MKELQKTLIFVAVAVLLTGAAFAAAFPTAPARRSCSTTRGSRSSPTSRTRSPAPTWRSSTTTRRPTERPPFKVKFKDGKWVIPSHHNYPADAKDRLAKTAAGVMGLTKDTIRSDRVEDQEDMGVIDPLDDQKSTTSEGARQAGHAPRRLGEGPGRLHHRQRDPRPLRASATSASPARSGPTASTSRSTSRPGSPTGSRRTC